jgi:hypothetical protein
MSWAGKLLGLYTRRRAAGRTARQLIDELASSGETVVERMARAADTPRHRKAAAHIIGIERWSARRLRTALGDTVVTDEYDGYRPSAALDMAALAGAFAEARQQTVALAERAADLPDSVTVRHNELGELSVRAWLTYIENHATRESWILRG